MDILNALTVIANYILIPSLAYGSQLALGALGVTLIFGVLRFSNFAHGDTMAFGTAFVILFTWLFQSWGLSLGPLPTALLALPFGIAVTIVLVLGTDKGYVLVQGANRFTDTGKALMADPEVRRSFLGG